MTEPRFPRDDDVAPVAEVAVKGASEPLAGPAPDAGAHGAGLTLLIGAVGVVFGDIGTSPL